MPTKLTDEQRVRAVWPLQCCEPFTEEDTGVRMWGIFTDPRSEEDPVGVGFTKKEAYGAALQHPTIQAHERTQRNVETQEHIEMGGTGSADTGVIPSKSEHMADTPELLRWNWCGESESNSSGGYMKIATNGEWVRYADAEALRAPLTGPAAEAMVRACAEAVWQMYYKPHNLTENALKERTFDAIAAVVVKTQGALLAEVEALHVSRAEWSGLAGTNAASLMLMEARAEAAEAKVRDLEAAAGAAKGERP